MLLPFGMQFAHAFESHEDLDCITTYEEHIHEHEFHCDVFHFKIDTNATTFTSRYDLVKIEISGEEVSGSNIEFISTKNNFESSRAPPILLF